MYRHRHAHGAPAVNPAPAHTVMAMASAAMTGVSEFGSWTAGRVRGMARSARAAWRERQATKVLSNLDDRTLKDIGISRSEIPYLARRNASNSGVNYRDMLR